MNVVFLASAIYGQEGGLETFNRRFVRALAELRKEGTLGTIEAVALSDGTPDPRIPEGVRLSGGYGSRVRTAIRFLRVVLSGRPGLVIYGYVGFVPLAFLVRLIRPAATHMLIVHGVEVWRKPTWIRKWAVRRCLNVILSVSRFTVDRMTEFFGLTRDRFRVFPNCLDVEAARPPAPRAATGKRTLISVTRLSHRDSYKNVDKVILAMPLVLRSFPDTDYLVVGDGDLRPGLESLAAATGVSERVRFLGWAEDAARDAAYASSDVFVLPSTGEGFGIVFLEAWSFGLPCIASNRDAAQEVIRHGVDGYCVDPDPAAIAGAIHRLLADPDHRRKMGESGRNRLMSRYSHDVFRGNLRSIVGEIT